MHGLKPSTLCLTLFSLLMAMNPIVAKSKMYPLQFSYQREKQSMAVDAEPMAAWPIETRCVAEAIQLPENWTFEGSIIATGWAGIHGMNMQWDTPRVLAFNDGWIAEGGYGTLSPGGYGALSPDGQWFAIPQATFRPTSELLQGFIDVTELLLYDLSDRRNSLRLEWVDSYEVFFGSGPSRYYTFRTPAWLDEKTVVYQRDETYFQVHIPDLSVEIWADPSEWQAISPVWVVVSYPSPDWSRVVIDGQLFDTTRNAIVAEIYRAAGNIDVPTTAWSPDSTEFIISGGLSTRLFDVDGNLLEVISSASEGEVDNYTYVNQNAFSADGSLLWLTLYPDRPTQSTRQTIAFVNRAGSLVVDTCINNFGMSAHFSPDGHYLALLRALPGQQQLQIFDFQNWQLYNTGIYHEGQIIGWRRD